MHQVTASLVSVDGGSEVGKPACTPADFEIVNDTNPATVDAEVNPGTSGSW